MRTLLRAAWIALASLMILPLHAADDPIPPSLRDWQGWVLKGHEYRHCPFVSNAYVNAGQPIPQHLTRCVWPERLNLAVDSRGGTFSQRWQVYTDSWVTLPGDAEHWPRDVRLNGAPAAVVSYSERPHLRLAAGNYTISGRFEWSSRPESIPLPQSTAIVDLFVDGSRVAQPERPGGGVSLGKRRSAEQAAAMEVQVYRLVNDDIPTYLVTRLTLNVAGEAREELLAKVLPDGFTPVSMYSNLPARLERDGTMRVQVRAGRHDINLFARGTGVAATLARPATGTGIWPKEEIWSFAASDQLRIAAVEGADGIDPAQANVPPEWRQYPAFRMDADSKLSVVERSRGLSNVDDNRLALVRNLWLDFDHGGFTVVDDIHGEMRRNWRLDMQPPFTLQSARQNQDLLLVTKGADGRAGVELRQPQLMLSTVSRKESGGGAMPATGWDSRFENVSGQLHLPPGHRLLAAIGADAAPLSWWENWGLWNVFGVLLIVGFVYWAAGWIPAAVAAVALLLTYQEAPHYIWMWGNLLAALAVARAAPEGRFRRWARSYRNLSFVVLGLALLPFLWMQVRFALHPQLAPPPGYSTLPFGVGEQYEGVMVTGWRGEAPAIEVPMAMEAAAPAADAAAPPAPMMQGVDAITAEDIGQFPDKNLAESLQRTRLGALNRQQVIQRYAAGTVLQAGPGIPEWDFNTYAYHWSGPVEAADTVRFVYVGPVVMFIWRLFGVVGLAVLFGWLAMLSYGKPLRWPGMPKAAPAAGWLGTLALAALLLGGGTPALAATPGVDAPSSQVLDELRQRLLAAPPCAPSCADLMSARVTVEGDRLDVVLQVSALANVAVATPHASDRWQLDEVTVNARGAIALARGDDASLWVPVTPGAHTIRLSGRLASTESIQLAFPQRPRVIEVSSRGWTVSGVNDGRLVSGSLELARERDAARAGPALEAGVEFPTFVKVHRGFNLDLDWTLNTTVVRVSPQRAAMSLEVPLMPGESVLTPGVKVRDGAALVGLGSGEPRLSWYSGLARAETLELSLPEDAARSEVWTFMVNPQWNVEFEGFPPVLPDNVNASTWTFRFIPRPGEALKLKVTRPEAVQGTTLAVDELSLETSVGARSRSTQLGFTYRSTQGGRHVIQLPPAARVTQVTFDGQAQQIRPEKGELPLQLAPGSHRFDIAWDESQDVGLLTRPSRIDLGTPASNLNLELAIPQSRWVLAAWGPGIGPALLYWAELVVFITTAWLLGRWSRSPLKFHEWLLLGLGLSTQSWFVFALTAAWLVTLRWREGWKPADDFKRWRFNTVQVVLALFTLVAVSTLLFSGIRNGLLASPDMNVQGAGSYNGHYAWFWDHTPGVIEGTTVLSVPMWVYRVLFFAWALWMALALVRWLRWAFNAWKQGGLWR